MGNLQIERGALRRRIAEALNRRVREGARDERGAVAIIFALALVVLVPMALGLFDLYTASEQKARLQDAVDAAALYAARSELTDDAEINALATKALNANLRLLRGATLVTANFRLDDNDTKVIGTATIKPLAIAPLLFSHHNVSVGTEVVRNSRNLEVALVLDGTGSMSGTKIADLKVAALELVDLVIKDQQTPFYSRVALVPWAAGVNLDTKAVDARGAVVGTNPVTGIQNWAVANTQKTISAVTKANPAVVTTSAAHGYVTGETVLVTSITGNNNMTALNGRYSTITKINNTQFRLDNVDTSSNTFKNYSGTSGRVAKCVRADCTMRVTANAHGYLVGDFIYIDGVTPSGLDTALDDSPWAVSATTTNTFDIFVPTGPTTAWTSGGTAYCTRYGCEYIRFTSQGNNTIKMYRVSKCVSERTGAEAYTDAAPSTARVSYHYPPAAILPGATVEYNSPCPEQSIKPLTSTKSTITNAINAMKAEGTTAGQIGVAWGWYMLSPNFSSVVGGTPAAEYTRPDTLKVAVIMTDGALNTAYCNGVSSSDSLMFPNDRIKNCNATNGSTFSQSLQLCQNMQDAGVIIYTVGFQITGDTTATNFVNQCATDPEHVYLPTTGSQLKDAFKSIGAELNNLRLAK